MDWIQYVFTFLGVLIGSGIIQFLISRKDKQKEDAKKDHDEIIKKEMKDHLTNVNNKWKEDYCDKNAKAIEDLIKEVRKGLQEREETGKRRYDEHHMAIDKLTVEYQKSVIELKQAIQKLTENDSKISESLGKIADKQDGMAEGMVGLAHDKIVYITDKVIKRGAVTMKEKATLESIYTPYTRLGGNSYAKKGMEHVDTLPVITEEEAMKIDKNIVE